MLEAVFGNVIQVTLTTTVILAVLIVLLPGFQKKYSAKWRYLMWFVIAVRLLIPFSPSLPARPIEIKPPSQKIQISIPVQNHVKPHNTGTPAIVPPRSVTEITQIHTLSLSEILALVWLAGIVLCILYYLLGYYLFGKSIKRYLRPIEETDLKVLWQEVRDEMKVTRDIPMYSCKKTVSPMMTGFFKPVLILPDFRLELTDLRLILKHELIHYKRKDIWFKLLLVCAKSLHWFNPFIYIMTDLADKDMEMVCDSEVIKNTDLLYKKKYSETILSVIHKGNVHNTAFSTYFNGGKKTMKKRFLNIFDKGSKKKGIAALGVILITVCLVGGLVAWGNQENTNLVILDKAAQTTVKNNQDTVNTTQTPDTTETTTEPKTTNAQAGDSNTAADNTTSTGENDAAAGETPSLTADNTTAGEAPSLIADNTAAGEAQSLIADNTAASETPSLTADNTTAGEAPSLIADNNSTVAAPSFTSNKNSNELASLPAEVRAGDTANNNPAPQAVQESTANAAPSLVKASTGTAVKSDGGKAAPVLLPDKASETDGKTDSIIYKNKDYGFSFTLPSSWTNYTIIADKWSANYLDKENKHETGPMLSIRHPKWTKKTPRQDIPILIFTLSQWKDIQNDIIHIGAAPVNPSELGRNSKYVFALPARYNFAFPKGYEEVQDIIDGNPLQPTEKIAK
ncbi:M56 family metallopeptidase [Anaerocolumna sp. AGMB13025]|uniref:M56 family metallopeptidase n=1 Tax=Anaerocolumna sp. AGMB13025 TaxID=3039116 RepID=UPI00241DE326|nr:M56 family metallopeptidase [Anaerocolumna sp. AGMB13025]WFR55117.1 M56 family metallopeptidase [Anaerocolumna sp. AGMB13025]